jgi:formylglycine-generating enzyme
MRRRCWLAVSLISVGAVSCHKPPSPDEPSADASAATTDVIVPSDAPEGEQDGEADAPVEDVADSVAPVIEAGRVRWCPKEMVNVAGRFCIDRFEASLVDDATSERISPHYPPEPGLAARMFDRWQDQRLAVGSETARAMPLPPLPDFERSSEWKPKAVSQKGVIPQAYVSGRVAGDACARAKKRLCTREEWTFACRGEGQTKYPYGSEYRAGVCNVHRTAHPAMKLHDNASAGHSDPRLGLVEAEDGPLLRPTGTVKTCVSRWGKDGIYEMVGNVDEWIEDPDGTFVGGFFSRGTTNGCDSSVSTHPLLHWDYSIGFRCCR